jgi:hypothetical protein
MMPAWAGTPCSGGGFIDRSFDMTIGNISFVNAVNGFGVDPEAKAPKLGQA